MDHHYPQPTFSGRPQPTPHQHPQAHYHPHSQQQQQFPLPDQSHSQSYASSTSGSDWDMRANSFFSDSGLGGNSGSGSGEFSEPSSVGSFGGEQDSGMGGGGEVYSPAPPPSHQQPQQDGGQQQFNPYASFPSFSSPRFAQHGSSMDFNGGSRAVVEADVNAGGNYESYGLGVGQIGGGRFQEMMASAIESSQSASSSQSQSLSRRNSFIGMDLSPSLASPGVGAAYATFASTTHDPSGPIGMMGPPPRPSQSRFSSNSGLILAPSVSSPGLTQAYPSPRPPLHHGQQQQQQSSHIYSAYQSSSSSSLQPSFVPQSVANSPTMSPSSLYAPSPSNNKLAPPSPASFSMNPTAPSEPFNASALGLPSLPSHHSSNGAGNAGGENWNGVYSTTGFDMVAVLARVAARPNPQIALGPVDLGCSFVVVDARKWDQPIVFASETFSRLTGYSNAEIIGRNCRFLQAPDGVAVRQGEKRKYTDGNAAHHLRRHLISGQESQASLINYCKGGKPFINLVTIVPITWDQSDEIAYYVGFQVDLVEQPSAIMEKMRDGSYVVNYSLSVNSIPATLELPHVEPFGDHNAVATPSAPMEVDNTVSDIIDTISEKGVGGLLTDASRKGFNRLLLEHCDDFVHVLSLKGSLLYVSPSAKRMLEYEPSELIGKALSSICHPSDIVSVLRELKEAGPNTPVNIVYRVRRKTSGYVWLEATGKLHLEQGKGRKCVILVGRPREVYRMSWSDLERLGGFGATEYWSKLTIGGLYLYATPAVDKVLGLDHEGMTGKTVAQLSPGGDATAVLEALQQASRGVATTVRHQMLAKSGTVDVVTHFYPARSETDVPASPMLPSAGANALTVIAQTNLFSSEVTKARNVSLPSAPSSRSSASSSGSSVPHSPVAYTVPSFTSQSSGSDGDESSSGGSSGATSFSAIQSTFKQLTPSASVSDNVFDELDSVRGTSWQFELHQMRLTNKKLREEKEALLAMQRKKRKRAQNPTDKLALPAGAATGKNAKRTCANCGRSSSAEWRTGPTGPKTLCNACGLRWSKVRPQITSANSSNSVSHHTHLPSPATTGSDSSSATPPLIPLVRRS